MIITFDQIDAQLRLDPVNLDGDNLLISGDALLDVSQRIIDLLGCDDFGFLIFEQHVELTLPDALDKAANIFQSVITSYEMENSDVWESYQLGGDDDVDYNGSIPLVIIEAMRKLS